MTDNEPAFYVPTRRLVVRDPDLWAEEAVAFAAQIAEAEGTRQPCFEVWYPAPGFLTDEETAAWETEQADTFDAVLVDLDAGSPADSIVTLPPYAELRP